MQQLVHQRFRVVAPLANGRGSSVFVAEHLELRRLVALKVLHANEGARTSLDREMSALRRVEHPHVVRPIEVGELPDGRPYLASEYHEGRTLAEIISQHGAMPEAWVVATLRQLLDALGALHRSGVVHGDVTSANVLCIAFDGPASPPRVCLLDFGSSHPIGEALSDEWLGTAQYMPPERALDRGHTPAGDIYSAGVLAYELLVSVPPFRASTSTEIRWQHLHQSPRRPSEAHPRGGISPEIERAVLRALEKDPAARFDSAEAFVAALREGTTPGVVKRGEHQPDADDVALGLLASVRKHWIEDVLDRTTDGVVLVRQSIETADAVLADPSSHQRGDTAPSLTDAFELANRALLVLGEPGHGKTVSLLRLARWLADRSVDATGRLDVVPVVFTLSSWREKDADLSAWMASELSAKYQVPRRSAAKLLQDGRILPLCDGLDDVPSARRASCVAAINALRAKRPRPGLVVTCRTSEYAATNTPLHLRGAIVLRGLERRDLTRHLKSASDRDLLLALDQSDVLDDLSRSPMLLQVMRVAYRDSAHFRGRILDRGEAVGTFFDTFVESALRRTSRSAALLRATLVRLAGLMLESRRTILLFEEAQPTWLPTRSARLVYALSTRLVVAATFAASTILPVGLSPLENQSFHTSLGFAARLAITGTVVLGLGFGTLDALRLRKGDATPLRIHLALLVGLAAGAAIGGVQYAIEHHSIAFVMGMEMGVAGAAVLALSRRRARASGDIATTELLAWSPRAIRARSLLLLVGSCVGLLLLFLSFEARPTAVYIAAAVGAIGLGVLGHRTRRAATSIAPNVGIHRTAGNAVAVAMLGFAVTTILFGFTYGVPYGACVGLTVGTVLGLWFGGIDVIHHYILRALLHRARQLRLDAARSLDEAVELGLLRRVGNGYIFMHGMLLAHLAARRTDP